MVRKVICGIYKITSPSNRIYIGQSIDLDKRIRVYKKGHCGTQNRLKSSFNKYGAENHTFEIIEECSEEDLNCRERYWQDFYDVLSKAGLNCKLTKSKDKSGKQSEETKNKISISHIGIGHSEETKKKLSKINKGSKKSITVRRKMSEAQFRRGFVVTEKHKEILRQNAKKRIGNCSKELSESISLRVSKPIEKYTKDGVFIESFKNITTASAETGINLSNISEVARGNRKTAGGYIWKFKQKNKKSNMERFESIEQFRNVIRKVKERHDFQGKDGEGNPIYQHLSNYPTLKFTGTVKLHGCFPSNAKVKMYDGSEKIISKIKVGDVVLGHNDDGELVPSKVLNTMINGKTDLWYKILIKTNQMGGVRSIICTENHEIYTINRGYVCAKDLTINDAPLFVKESFDMSEKIIDMLNGKLLGDAYIHKQYGNLGITFGHKEEHEGYIDHCLDFLDFWSNPKKRKRVSGYNSKMIDVSTLHNIATEYYFKCWLNAEGKKVVPTLKLSKYTMAYWYMDDGSLSHTDKQQDRANFAICGFNDDEAVRLILSLKEYGFKNPVLYKTDEYNRIRLNKDDAEKLFLDIRELVPSVMQYKLPEYHRGFFKEVEKDLKINKFYDLPVSIEKISTISSKKYSYSTKYDIETETHNYFVNSMLVHNSNASIVKYSDGRTEFQSRERVLSLEADNANFMQSMLPLDFDPFFNQFVFNDFCAIYGEWCGGNIQKGVAINGLPKMFVIFAVKVDGEYVELPSYLYDNDKGIYNILQFPTYEIDIDFNNPELSQNKLIEMTIAVEDECPVGKYFGKSGIGEGIVFSCGDLRFKSKGEKHSASKVKVLNEVDVVAMEGINQFIEMSVTENRLQQGLRVMRENNYVTDSKNTGEFLRWVVTDVLKEEKDTLEVSGLDEKKVKASIVNKARAWYLSNM